MSNDPVRPSGRFRRIGRGVAYRGGVWKEVTYMTFRRISVTACQPNGSCGFSGFIALVSVK